MCVPSLRFYFGTTDINECELGVDQCTTNATCSNTEGSYECNCNTGFTGDGISCCMWLTKFIVNITKVRHELYLSI